MEYKFQPIIINSKKYKNMNLEFEFNFSIYDSCSDSWGLFIFLRITIFKNITIHLTPLGSFNFRNKG